MYPLRNTPVESITADNLRALVSASVSEGRHVEFKRDLHGKEASQRKELLADVTAFANTDGGDLIFGIAQDPQGTASEVQGLEGINPDDIKQQLEQAITSGTAPSLTVHIHAVEMENGAYVIILRIPRSWSAPHAVWRDRDSRFWYRGSAGKIQMEVDQIRAAMNRNARLGDRIQSFRDERIALLSSPEQQPSLITEQPMTVLHVVPFSAFDPGRTLDIQNVVLRRVTPPGSYGSSHRFNIDGLIFHDLDRDAQGYGAYSQLFRNGCIEAAENMLLFHPNRKEPKMDIPGQGLGKMLIDCVGESAKSLMAVGEMGPVAILFSMIGVDGWQMHDGQHLGRALIDRAVLKFPAITISSLDDLEGRQLDRAVRPLIDMIWNACGRARCPLFNDDGEWIG